jgi:hypothetical protein
MRTLTAAEKVVLGDFGYGNSAKAAPAKGGWRILSGFAKLDYKCSISTLTC